MAVPKDAHAPRGLDEALLVFRAAVEHHSDGGASIEELRHPLRQFYAHAHRERLTPEQVLIRVKHALDGLSVLAADHPMGRESIRSRIISLAIRTYYTDRGRDDN